MDPIDFMSIEELRSLAKEQQVLLSTNNPTREQIQRAIRAEDGSERRFQDIFSKRPGWWVIHNILAHGLIGVMPIGPFFKFHDYTARRLRGGKS